MTTNKQTTLREIFNHLAGSYLGMRLTNGQLKAAASKLYDQHKLNRIIRPAKPAQFFWENNNKCSRS